MNREAFQVIAEDHDHTTLPGALTYRVSGMRIEIGGTSSVNDWLEMTLTKDNSRVLLRFEGVQGLSIDEGFPYLNPHVRILDIGNRGWDGLKVRVQSFEQGPAISFYARSVERIEK